MAKNVYHESFGENAAGNLTKIVAISFNQYHGMALVADGTVWSWGDNSYCQNGTGPTHIYAYKVLLPGGTNILDKVVSIDCGVRHSLALRTDGTVYGWGESIYGSLSQGNAYTYVCFASPLLTAPATPFVNAVAISAGYRASMVLLANGNIFTCGSNDGGGIGFPISIVNKDYLTIVSSANGIQNNSIEQIKRISFGLGYDPDLIANCGTPDCSMYNSAIVVRGDGNVYAWGSNWFGQLGKSISLQLVSILDQSLLNELSPYLPSTKTVGLSYGESHGASIRGDGKLVLWGSGSYKQLGTLTNNPCGTFQNYTLSTPQLSTDGDANNLLGVACGISTTHVLKADGKVYSMGTYKYGNVGDGLWCPDGSYCCAQTVEPYNIGALTVGFDVGVDCYDNQKIGSFAAAVTSDGRVLCWGNAGSYQTGQINNGVNGRQPTPDYVKKWDNTGDLNDIVQVACSFTMGFALDSKGQIWCWGSPQTGSSYIRARPLPVNNFSEAAGCMKAISSNGHFLLMLAPDGYVWAWGANDHKQCGISQGTYPDLVVPCGGGVVLQNGEWRTVQIGQISKVRYIVAGVQNSYAIKSDGKIWSWGSNSHGQLALGNGYSTSHTPRLTKRESPEGGLVDMDLAIVGAAGCRTVMFQTFNGPLSAGSAQEYTLGNGSNSPNKTAFGSTFGALSSIKPRDNEDESSKIYFGSDELKPTNGGSVLSSSQIIKHSDIISGSIVLEIPGLAETSTEKILSITDAVGHVVVNRIITNVDDYRQDVSSLQKNKTYIIKVLVGEKIYIKKLVITE